MITLLKLLDGDWLSRTCFLLLLVCGYFIGLQKNIFKAYWVELLHCFFFVLTLFWYFMHLNLGHIHSWLHSLWLDFISQKDLFVNTQNNLSYQSFYLSCSVCLFPVFMFLVLLFCFLLLPFIYFVGLLSLKKVWKVKSVCPTGI